jgi:glycosyl transferase family 25
MKVISMTLRRAPERGEYIERHLKRLKLDYQLVDCIDFKDYTDEEYQKLYNAEAVAQNPYWTKGVIGCTLSHLKIYDAMIAQNIPVALVLEDDAMLPPDIASILDRIEAEIGGDEVIALSFHNHHKKETELSTQGRTKLPKGLELLYPVNLDEIASTMGYVITLEAARKLIRLNRPVSFSCDYWGTYYRKGGFSSFRCLYPVQIKPASFRTTIDYAASKTMKSRFAAWVRKNRIPVLFPMLEKRSNQMLDEKYRFRLVDAPPFMNQESAS